VNPARLHHLVIAGLHRFLHNPASRREAGMDNRKSPMFGAGTSILGGAAGGLSYEGALRDAVAREDIARRREAGRNRRVAAPQNQARPPMPEPRKAS
jgi:type IV secretory pathway TrbL component